MTLLSALRISALTIFLANSYSQPVVALGADWQETPGQTAPATQTATGTVSAVSNEGFALDMKGGDKTPQTVPFLLDTNTKVQGKLEVGSVANVQFRTDKGKNIAITVVVQTNS